MTHRNIKRFQIEGELLSDSAIPRTRAQYETLMIHDMRGDGYVPVLDMDTAWSTIYDSEHDKWHFVLTVHGVYLGKKEAMKWHGVLGETKIPKGTPRNT